MLTCIIANGDTVMPVSIESTTLWICFAFTIAISIALYVLRSIGLYTLAKKQNVEKAYLAFIPCLWMYVAVKLIGNFRFFGMKKDKLALIFTIIFSVSELLLLAYNVIIYFPVVSYFITSGAQASITLVPVDIAEIVEVSGTRYFDGVNYIYMGNGFVMPYKNVKFMAVLLDVIFYFAYIIDFAVIFITVTVYINLFRKFWPQHYMLATIFSILGFFAPFVFAIRNNKPVNYNEYMRNRYGMYYSQPPYTNNGQGANNYNGYNHQQNSPFSEYDNKANNQNGNRNNEPFSEFDDEK